MWKWRIAMRLSPIILCSVVLAGFVVPTPQTACGQTKEAKGKYAVWVYKMVRGNWVKQPERTLDTDEAKQALDYVAQVKAVKGWTATTNAPAPLKESIGGNRPAKVPPSLSQWELSVEGVRGGHRANIRPICVFSDGRCECEAWELSRELSDLPPVHFPPPWDKLLLGDAVVHKGTLVVRKGTLNDQDRTDLFTAAAVTFNSVNFIEPVIGEGPWDVPQYDIRLASGSRAMRVVLDRTVPEHMGFDIPLARGFRVLNRICHELRPENQTSVRTWFRVYSPDRRVQRPAPGREPVPGLSADWMSVSFEITSQGCRMKAEVHNPNDNPNDRYKRGYNERGHKRSKNDMEISIGFDSEWVPPRSVAISDRDRNSFFEDARFILNQFELHDPNDGEDEGDMRCIVRIDGWLRDLEVEFKLNDALSDDWRSRIFRILEICHRYDEAFPTLGNLSGGDPLGPSTP
jgi:hypothetical protein